MEVLKSRPIGTNASASAKRRALSASSRSVQETTSFWVAGVGPFDVGNGDAAERARTHRLKKYARRPEGVDIALPLQLLLVGSYRRRNVDREYKFEVDRQVLRGRCLKAGTTRRGTSRRRYWQPCGRSTYRIIPRTASRREAGSTFLRLRQRDAQITRMSLWSRWPRFLPILAMTASPATAEPLRS